MNTKETYAVIILQNELPASINLSNQQRQPEHQQQQFQNLNFWNKILQCRRQFTGILGGILILFISGMHIAWGIWRTDFYGEWLDETSDINFIIIITSWYISSIFGYIIGAYLIQHITKKKIYCFTSIIMTISSISFIIKTNYYQLILCGRLLAGLSYGLTYLTIIIHASENAIAGMRGFFITTINCVILFGIFITTIITEIIVNNCDRIFGIINLIISIFAVIITLKLTIESISFLIQRNDNDNNNNNEIAICTLKYIRMKQNYVGTENINYEFDEMKLMLDEDKLIENSRNLCTHLNYKPLFLLTIAMLQNLLANNLPFNVILITFTTLICDDWASTILIACRLISALFTLYTIDRFGRKLHFTLSGGLAGTCLLLFGGLLASYNFYLILFWIPGVCFLIFQFFIGIGIDQIPILLLSEGFNSKIKFYSIAFSLIIADILNCILISIFFSVNTAIEFIYSIMFITSIIIVIFTILLQILLPETCNMTLRETKHVFRYGSNINININNSNSNNIINI